MGGVPYALLVTSIKKLAIPENNIKLAPQNLEHGGPSDVTESLTFVCNVKLIRLSPGPGYRSD